MGAVESHPDVQRYEGQLPERAGWQAPKVSIAKQDDKYVMGKVGHDGKPDGHKPIRSCDHCPDILFFIGWVISTLVLIVLGLRFGIADTMSVYDDDAGATAKGKQGVAAIFMLTIIFAIAVSFLWVTMSARLGYYIIQTFIGVGVSALVLVGLIEGAATNQRKMPRRPLLSPHRISRSSTERACGSFSTRPGATVAAHRARTRL